MDTHNTRPLDPGLVRASRWANRHASSFCCADFERLKCEIANAGGNVQPIKVRPVNGGEFEIVFGHRRHRACQELGLPVLATVVSIDDRGLWEEMERENRSRADLSPFEQGCHYKAAIDAGLYPSIRRMASAIGVDISQAAKAIRIAEFPEEVIAAFNSPNDIQVNWAPALQAARERDPSGLIARAKGIRLTDGPRPSPKAIFATLLGAEGVEPFHTRRIEVKDSKNNQCASIIWSKTGYTIRIKDANLPIASVEAALRALLGA